MFPAAFSAMKKIKSAINGSHVKSVYVVSARQVEFQIGAIFNGTVDVFLGLGINFTNSCMFSMHPSHMPCGVLYFLPVLIACSVGASPTPSPPDRCYARCPPLGVLDRSLHNSAGPIGNRQGPPPRHRHNRRRRGNGSGSKCSVHHPIRSRVRGELVDTHPGHGVHGYGSPPAASSCSQAQPHHAVTGRGQPSTRARERTNCGVDCGGRVAKWHGRPIQDCGVHRPGLGSPRRERDCRRHGVDFSR